MYTLHLDKMKFFAHHGWHDEEGIIGAEFEVAAAVSFHAENISGLQDTVNYVTVYHIIKEKFFLPVLLLEDLAQNIIEEIHKIDRRITSINITINKLNPPIANFTGTVGISCLKSFS